MIGRGRLVARPWLFAQVAAALRGDPIPPEPSLAEQKQLLLEHYRLVVEQFGPEKGTILMRKLALPLCPRPRRVSGVSRRSPGRRGDAGRNSAHGGGVLSAMRWGRAACGIRRHRSLGLRSAGPVMLVFGNALRSSLTPASVTLVPHRLSNIKLVNPLRCSARRCWPLCRRDAIPEARSFP